MSKIACVLAALLPLAGCASSGGSSGSSEPAGVPVLARFIDYRSGVVMELVNESHTDRLEQYSQPRHDAGRKVQTDAVMEGLVEYLEDRGFDRWASAGPAPRTADSFLWSLQLEGPGGARHVGLTRTMPEDAKQSLREMQYAFLATFNSEEAYQSIESPQQVRDQFRSQTRR